MAHRDEEFILFPYWLSSKLLSCQPQPLQTQLEARTDFFPSQAVPGRKNSVPCAMISTSDHLNASKPSRVATPPGKLLLGNTLKCSKCLTFFSHKPKTCPSSCFRKCLQLLPCGSCDGRSCRRHERHRCGHGTDKPSEPSHGNESWSNTNCSPVCFTLRWALEQVTKAPVDIVQDEMLLPHHHRISQLGPNSCPVLSAVWATAPPTVSPSAPGATQEVVLGWPWEGGTKAGSGLLKPLSLAFLW